MRLGRSQDVASILLILLGAVFVLNVVLSPFGPTPRPVPDLVFYGLLGTALWRSGQLVRRGQAHGYALGVSLLLVMLLAPFFFGGTPTLAGFVFGSCMTAIVTIVGLVGRYTPPAPVPKTRVTTLLRAAGRTLAVLGFVLAVSAVSFTLWLSRAYSVPPGHTIFDVVRGRWAWTSASDGCRTDPETITFGPGDTTMTIAFTRPFHTSAGRFDSLANYVVIASSASRLRARIPGETRVTSSGQPVVWDLVLRSKDSFAWHRTDWQWWGFTGDLARCPDSR